MPEPLRRTERFTAGRNLLTPHAPAAYPGVLVVKPGPGWNASVIVPEDGATIVGLGGETVYAYQTIDGGRADGFELRPGDRATLVRSGLPFSLVEWRVERRSPSS
jgi:hypothetical protein